MNSKTDIEQSKVADALRHSWVYRLPQWLWPYAQLARWERPIGWQLLLWPCCWSFILAYLHEAFLIRQELAGSGFLSPRNFDLERFQFESSFFWISLLLFLIGAVLMRGAGCTYNDLADTDIDMKVARTRSRPIPSGRVSKKSAMSFLMLQCICGLIVLLILSKLNVFVLALGASSLIFVAIYPFMKRITWWPQLFLGFAFSWGALMGWGVYFKDLSPASVLLYLGAICWVIGYDTIYAHQDREDDAIAGVKSTARLFAEKSKTAITLLYSAALFLFFCAYLMAIPLAASEFLPAYIGLAAGGVHMFWQMKNLDINDGDACLKLFKSNSLFGWILFSGLIISYLLNVFFFFN